MDKPNFILITTDQQRFDTIHAFGNGSIYTPHLNWLADEGIAFRRCYADSPICMPSRATIMTGKHGYTTGLTGNQTNITPMKDAPTLPGILTANGYQTRAQGKMHFHPIRANYGFEHMELPLDYYRSAATDEKNGIPKGHGVGENEIEPVISTVDETKSATRWVVKRSIDFIETRDETRPFFLWTSFAKPHPPFDPCYNYWALYQNKILPPPVTGDWSENLQAAPQGFYHSVYCLNNGYRMSPEARAEVKRAYYACITQIDYSLGLLFARLRELELLENTWIIFTADHGDMMGDHNMFAKSVFLEGSAHIPMIVRPPKGSWRKPGGKACDSLATLADVMPTVLSIAGIETPAGAEGASLLEIAENKKEDRVFYGNSADTNFAIMRDGYKYTWTSHNGDELLFNIDNDPEERRDLSRAKPETAARMKKLLTEQVAGYNENLLENGGLKVIDHINGPEDVPKWPGFHSTYHPSDVLH